MEKGIAIVMDEPVSRLELRQMLEQKNYLVVGEASEVFGAVELCKKYHPTLVMIDNSLPMLDGIGVSKVINKENLAGGIILMSQLQDSNTLEKARQLGICGYVPTPIDENILHWTLQIALGIVEQREGIKCELELANAKLNERKMIEKAKGIFSKKQNISEEEAYAHIRKLSMDRRMTLGDIARIIIIGYEDN